MVNKDIEFEEVVFNADRKKNQHFHVARGPQTALNKKENLNT